MLRPEQLLTGVLLGEQKSYTNLDQPFTYQGHQSLIQVLIEDEQVLDSLVGTEGLDWRYGLEAAEAVVAKPELLDPTLQVVMAGGNGESNLKINHIDGALYQAGTKALILIHRVKNDKKDKFFVTYVSRGEIGTALAEEATADFHNLKDLSRRARERLTLTGADQLQIVNPITLNTCEIQGKSYPCFTMPFIDNRAELSIDANMIADGRIMTIPHFRYAVPIDDRMRKFNETTESTSLSLTTALFGAEFGSLNDLRRILGTVIGPYLYPQQSRAPSGKQFAHVERRNLDEYLKPIAKQYRDILIGAALIYLLSDGYFPAQFSMNCGDFMVRPRSAGGFDITLVTIRGGWKHLGNDAAWIQKMREHGEVFMSRRIQHLGFRPFVYFPDDVLNLCLTEAKKLIKR